MQNEVELLDKIMEEQDVGKKELLFAQMAQYINYLLLNDFDKLVNILYRIDVDEEKLKQVLKEEPQQDASQIIVRLLIERQQQKNRFRRNTDSGPIAEEEKW